MARIDRFFLGRAALRTLAASVALSGAVATAAFAQQTERAADPAAVIIDGDSDLVTSARPTER